MERALPTAPVVHLELRTGDLSRACAFYARLFGWQSQTVDVGASTYVALSLGSRIEGGVVENDSDGASWLPYVAVVDIVEATERARLLGATVLLAPREGLAGWRSVVASPAGAEVALWQAKGSV